jgi:hypothetical protein
VNDSIIKEIGRSYIVSSWLPAALFVSIGLVVFREFLPQTLFNNALEGEPTVLGGWFLILIFTFWLAFMLYSSVDWTAKLFEGYFFPEWLSKILIERQIENFEKLKQSIQEYRSLVDQGTSDKYLLRAKRQKAYADLQQMEVRLPYHKEYLLPTQLGNVLRASELYSWELYKLEGITLWPRLYKILPENITYDLEEKNNHLMFLLHSSLLSFMIGISALLITILRFGSNFARLAMVSGTNRSFPSNDIFIQNLFSWNYFILGIIFVLVGYFIYRISLKTAEDFGLIVRSGYDLYRHDLLKQLKQPIPDRLKDERKTWAKISELLIAGNKLGLDLADINYVVEGKSEKPVERILLLPLRSSRKKMRN